MPRLWPVPSHTQRAQTSGHDAFSFFPFPFNLLNSLLDSNMHSLGWRPRTVCVIYLHIQQSIHPSGSNTIGRPCVGQVPLHETATERTGLMQESDASSKSTSSLASQTQARTPSPCLCHKCCLLQHPWQWCKYTLAGLVNIVAVDDHWNPGYNASCSTEGRKSAQNDILYAEVSHRGKHLCLNPSAVYPAWDWRADSISPLLNGSTDSLPRKMKTRKTL